MPGRTLPSFHRQPAHEYRIVLGARAYRVRFVWRWRLVAWYADIWHADGTAVALNRRLSPGSLLVPDLNVTGARGDLLMTFGEDGYAQDALGDRLRVLHFTRDELTATAAASDAPVIVL